MDVFVVTAFFITVAVLSQSYFKNSWEREDEIGYQYVIEGLQPLGHHQIIPTTLDGRYGAANLSLQVEVLSAVLTTSGHLSSIPNPLCYLGSTIISAVFHLFIVPFIPQIY